MLAGTQWESLTQVAALGRKAAVADLSHSSD